MCITRTECSIINYNIQQKVCILGKAPCIVLEADEAFQLNYIGIVDRTECFRWVPSSSFDNVETVSSPNCHHREPNCYVGRLVSSFNVLPGKYLRDALKVWTVFEGANVNSVDSDSNKEILDVRAGCQVTWMPFRAGDAVPKGAMKGGFLASNGATLYVIRGSAETYTGIFGYYDPEANIGLIAHSGVESVTDMELLVVLWSFVIEYQNTSAIHKLSSTSDIALILIFDDSVLGVLNNVNKHGVKEIDVSQTRHLTSYQVTYNDTVYPKKYAHDFCFAVLCCGYTLTDFPISIRLTSLALWQSNDCPSASKSILMNMDKYFMWIHYERLHNHNKVKHNKTVCIFLVIYCTIT